MNIPQMEPTYGTKEVEAVTAYLNQTPRPWLMEHVRTRMVEERLAELLDVRHVVLVSNGTVAIEVALAALDVAYCEEVEMAAWTHSAAAAAESRIGCDVRYLDNELPDLGTLNTDSADVAIVTPLNGRTGATYGTALHCRQMVGQTVIEDAAQGLGSTWQGKALGTFGRIGTLSFSVPKIITCGAGGACITNDGALAERIRSIKDFGRDKPGVDHWAQIGTNAKITDLQAVILDAQLDDLDRRIAIKRANHARYERNLAGLAGLTMLATDLSECVPWMHDVLIHEGRRQEVAGKLKAAGIGTRPGYPCLPDSPAFQTAGDWPNARRLAAELLWLPSSVQLTADQIDYVCEHLRRALE